MSNKNDFYKVVSSLTRTEIPFLRRYIRLYQMEKNCSRLFDILIRHKIRTDQDLLPLISGEKFGRNLSLVKSRLFSILTRGLLHYHENNPSHRGLFHLQIAHLLYGKGLFRSCTKAVHEIIREGTESGQFLTLESYGLIRQMYRSRLYVDCTAAELEEITGKETKSLEHLAREVHIRQIYDRYNLEVKMSGLSVRKPEEYEKVDRLAWYLLDMKETDDETYRSRMFRYMMSGNYYYIKGDKKKSLFYHEKLVSVIESVSPLQTSNYIFALNNLLTTLLDLKKMNAFAENLKKLEALAIRDKKYTFPVLFRAYFLRLNACLHMGDFSEGLAVAESIQRFLSENRAKPDPEQELAMYYTLATFHFGAGNFSRCLYFLNRILESGKPDIRSDIQAFSRLLLLLVHYEMGNRDLLEHLIRSVYRFMMKRKRLYALEESLIRFLRKTVPSLDPDNEKQIRNALQMLLDELKPMQLDPYEKQALDYFDFISWLESKIIGRTFGEIVKGKYQREKNE